MGDEAPETMNLDLNLGPLAPSSPSREQGSGSGLALRQPVSLDDSGEEDRLNRRLAEAVRVRRWRWQQVPIPPETRNISMELVGNLVDVNGPQTGEGSVAAVERVDEPVKTCENTTGDLGLEALGQKDDVEKGSNNDGGFFDCNICLDLASDPVVTCCGHLFCWPCLFRWLHVHSDAKECPVCKGEVNVKHVTPIYGRGSSTREPEEDLGLKIPIRPQARRVESWRQTIPRNSFTFSMEEMFRRLGSRFEMARDLVPPHDPESAHEPIDRSSLINQILISRRLRREQNMTAHPDDVVDLNQTTTSFPPALLRRSQTQRAIQVSLLNSSEPVPETYFRGHPAVRNQEPPQLNSSQPALETYFRGHPARSQEPPADDRDSFSSIGAVIHSGSQTIDTAVEIDSTVSLSTSSSRRRRIDASRASDVDSGESRAPRRRRVN